ncbi:hypothetical protein QYF61_007419 [Mycteria americana]|uniref:Uncharacterized protein n=1 Tax=Mycteria americana TaxID=33587 RepID=A0AAN7RTI0_MYCAM|nr:hypothetical protein QYF61_007419 [Mycteria americana]
MKMNQGDHKKRQDSNEMVTTRPLSLSEHIVTWLLRCWDSGASSPGLEGKEAKQLGSLSREGGIDKATGKEA